MKSFERSTLMSAPTASTRVRTTAVPAPTTRALSGLVCGLAGGQGPRPEPTGEPRRAPHELGDAHAHEQEHAEVPEGQDPQVPRRGDLHARPDEEHDPRQRGEHDEDERGAAPPDDAGDDGDGE